jgi:hypothetical protein
MSELPNGWARYQERVLAELHDLRRDVREIDQRINDMQARVLAEVKVKLAMLEVRSGIIGAIAGSIPAGVLVLVQVLGGAAGPT